MTSIRSKVFLHFLMFRRFLNERHLQRWFNISRLLRSINWFLWKRRCLTRLSLDHLFFTYTHFLKLFINIFFKFTSFARWKSCYIKLKLLVFTWFRLTLLNNVHNSPKIFTWKFFNIIAESFLLLEIQWLVNCRLFSFRKIFWAFLSFLKKFIIREI